MGALALSLCVVAVADNVQKDRAEIRQKCNEAFSVLYREKPELKARIAKSAGYGCFYSFGVTVLVGGAGGHGIVHNNATNKDTYMKMGQASAGIELGIKDYREVLIFKDRKTLEKFVASGWEFSGSGGAAAQVKGEGGEVGAATSGSEAIEIYPMTKTGLALGVSAAGRKYWKDDNLN
jgi:hypothetical protein